MLLSKFTWHEYWIFIAAAIVLYYLAVTGFYYRSAFLSFITGKNKVPNPYLGHRGNHGTHENSAPPPEDFDEMEQGHEADGNIAEDLGTARVDDSSQELQADDDEDDRYGDGTLALMEKTSEAISEALGNHKADGNKEELIYSLSHAVKETAIHKHSADLREALDWHISHGALTLCNVEFTPKEVQRIWDMAKT